MFVTFNETLFNKKISEIKLNRDGKIREERKKKWEWIVKRENINFGSGYSFVVKHESHQSSSWSNIHISIYFSSSHSFLFTLYMHALLFLSHPYPSNLSTPLLRSLHSHSIQNLFCLHLNIMCVRSQNGFQICSCLVVTREIRGNTSYIVELLKRYLNRWFIIHYVACIILCNIKDKYYVTVITNLCALA